MLDELQSLGLVGAARALGVDPFEVMRLRVAAGHASDAELRFTQEEIDTLRTLGGIEGSWWESVELPEDANPLRQRVRAAVDQLIKRGRIGETRTRMDNVWRGLPYADQEFLQQALSTLADEGVLQLASAPTGLEISVATDALPRAASLAQGEIDTDGLTALYQV